jgi:hypothetical protein
MRVQADRYSAAGVEFECCAKEDILFAYRS